MCSATRYPSEWMMTRGDQNEKESEADPRERHTDAGKGPVAVAKGMAEAAQHVDNPGQTPMKDGPG